MARTPDRTYKPALINSTYGLVFSEVNDDDQAVFGEEGGAGVTIKVDGTDFLGDAVHLSQATDAAGTYVFQNLLPGNYTIAEPVQPVAYTAGINSVGTGGGTACPEKFELYLAAGLDAMNYNYGELPAATGTIALGQTAGIGFWNN
jgi:large repetitive protein